MTACPRRRPVASLLAGTVLVLGATLLATPVDAAEPAQRRNTNPTGTASGSSANGTGNLQVSLAATADGRIKVTWERSQRVRGFKKVRVQVSPSRKMNVKVKTYRVSRKRHALVVRHAFGAVPTSGNYSFVKVVGYRRDRSKTASPAKWIQAPITHPCTAAPQDRLTVAAFNVRSWASDRHLGPDLNWNLRGDNVVSEILRSGARALAIQEASGSERLNFGTRPQRRWILDRLNEVDPDPSSNWVDALTDDAYRPPKGRRPGLVGTRVFYDANRYRKLDAGLERIVDPAFNKDSLIAWARLQSVAGNQAPFVLTSNHLRVGVVGSRTEWEIRARQTTRTIQVMRSLRSRFNDQVILGGDLNSTANTLPYNNVHQALMNAGFYDAYATASIVGGQFPTTQDSKFPVYRTPLRRDYILTLGSAKGSCGYRNQTYGSRSQIASDHFLQLATVPLPPLR